MDAPIDLETTPLHLGLGASTLVLEPFDGSMEWYGRYTERVAADGTEARLVSLHRFTEPWDVWEMHPNGTEVVLCVGGQITLHQQLDGQESTITLGPGQAAINQPGTWHTADVEAEATVLFITAGVGTEHRPR